MVSSSESSIWLSAYRTLGILACILAFLFLFSSCTEERAPEIAVNISLVHPPETREFLENLKQSFEQSDQTLVGGIRVRINLVEEQPTAAARKIASGELKTDGWLASSTALVHFTNGSLRNLGPKQVDCREIFSSPIVLATIQKNSQILGAKDNSFSWNEFIASLTREIEASRSPESVASFSIAHPDYSISGLSAMFQLAHFSLGTVAGTLDANQLRKEAFVKKFSQYVGLVGHVDASDDAVLDRITRTEDIRIAFALTTEQQLSLFNAKRSLLGGVGPIAFYPREGSVRQDYSLCLSNADWVTPPQRAGFSLFASFATSRGAQKAVLRYGFRPIGKELVEITPAEIEQSLLGTRYGVKSAAATQSPLPFPADVVRHLLRSWADFKKPAAIVVLLDTSGTTLGGALYSGQRIAQLVIDQASKNDKWSILTFADKVQFFSGFDDDKSTVSSKLKEITAGGGSALYLGIYESLKSATDEKFSGYRKNVLIFTDGKDNKSTMSLSDLIDFVNDRRRHYDLNLHIIGIRTAGVDLSDLQSIADAADGRLWVTTLGDAEKTVLEILTRNW